MQIPLYQIDAFTNEAFRGNPAAICPLDEWLDDALMLQIAAENNLSETAFFVACEQTASGNDAFELRWFTPTVEVDLCGHATLASAWVLWHELGFTGERIRFQTRSGEVSVSRDAQTDCLSLNFPSKPVQAVPTPAGLATALGATPSAVFKADNYLLHFESEHAVRALQPDFAALAQIPDGGIIVTAPADSADVDFVSRYFAPSYGINEDPVTGSTHCSLVPYWAELLGRNKLMAKQVSARGGELRCELQTDRVQISGQAVLTLRGELSF